MTVEFPCLESTRWMSVAAPLDHHGELSASFARSLAPQNSPACVPKGWALPAMASCLAIPSIKVSLRRGTPKERSWKEKEGGKGHGMGKGLTVGSIICREED